MRVLADVTSMSDWQHAITTWNQRVVIALIARRIPAERARELAQEAWTRIMEQHDRGALHELELPGLIIRQAFFLSQDQARRDRIRQPAEMTDVASSAPSPERTIMTRQLLARAQAMVAVLPPRMREIFHLCYQEPELPHDTIAARLGVSVQHVRQTLYDVRKQLRVVLEEPS